LSIIGKNKSFRNVAAGRVTQSGGPRVGDPRFIHFLQKKEEEEEG
jgi:hypothetical protein